MTTELEKSQIDKQKKNHTDKNCSDKKIDLLENICGLAAALTDNKSYKELKALRLANKYGGKVD